VARAPIHGDDRNRQLLQLRLDLSRHRFAVASPRNLKHLPSYRPTSRGAHRVAGLPRTSDGLCRRAAAAFEEPDHSLSIEHVNAAGHRERYLTSYLFISLAFPLTLRKQLVEHGRLAGFRLQESHDLVEPLLGHRVSKSRPTSSLQVAGVPFFQAEALAQFCGNYYLAF